MQGTIWLCYIVSTLIIICIINKYINVNNIALLTCESDVVNTAILWCRSVIKVHRKSWGFLNSKQQQWFVYIKHKKRRVSEMLFEVQLIFRGLNARPLEWTGFNSFDVSALPLLLIIGFITQGLHGAQLLGIYCTSQ